MKFSDKLSMTSKMLLTKRGLIFEDVISETDYNNLGLNMTNLIDIDEIRPVGLIDGTSSQIRLEVHSYYLEPHSKVELLEFYPYIRERLVTKPGEIMIKGDTGVFRENFEMDIGKCFTQNDKRFCKEFTIPTFEEREGNCANFLLDKSGTNKCEMVELEVPMIVKSDCHGNDSFISSFHSSYGVDVTCNGRLEKGVELDAGIHEIKTECKLNSGDVVLTPQVKAKASENFVTKLIEKARYREGLDFSLIVTCVVVVSVCGVLIIFNITLMMFLCCPDGAKRFFSGICCRIRLSITLGKEPQIEDPTHDDPGRMVGTNTVTDTKGYTRVTGRRNSQSSIGSANVGPMFALKHSYRSGESDVD